MTGSVNKIIYASKAVGNWESNELHELGRAACISNIKRDITGVLFFSHGRFIQLLEGPNEQLDQLFTDIQVDSRHTEINVLTHTIGVKRSCPQWAMAFMNLDEVPDLDTEEIHKQLFTTGNTDKTLDAMMRLISQIGNA